MSDIPHGFVLSEAALYSFECQDVYTDVLSFAVAIPEHLRPLFLIPIKMERITASESAARIADGSVPTGDTDAADMFGSKTFVYDDNEPTIPSSDDGSIFDTDGADNITHHQEYNFDENIQSPTDTSYMLDVEIDQYFKYPYRTQEKVIHSSDSSKKVIFVRLALEPKTLETKVPDKIKENAGTCSVSLTSYDKKTRVFTFSVNCGNTPRTVQAGLNEIDHVALSCDCPFWKWNGPEFHAKSNDFMLGQPFGSASTPDERDPDRKYWLCKHSYAVLRRLDSFVSEIVDENWDAEEKEILDKVDDEWDRMEGASSIPLEELEDEDVEVDWKPEGNESEQFEEEPEAEPEESDESEDADESEEEADESEEEAEVKSEEESEEEDYEMPEKDQEPKK